MSQSFGNRGRDPERPSGHPGGFNFARPDQEMELSEEDELELEDRSRYQRPGEVANRMPRKPSNTGSMRRVQGPGRRQASAQVIVPGKIEHTKRLVALIVDSLAWYFVAMLVTIVPFVNHVLSLPLTWLFLLLTRDYWFVGRGIGKNVMGLKVVDVKTGAACSLKQSVLRNIIILAPFAVLQIIGVILTLVREAWLSEAVKSVVEVVGMVYLAIVLPLECYRAYNRDDSLRLGDQLAGTAIVEAPTDFSNPFSRLAQVE